MLSFDNDMLWVFFGGGGEYFVKTMNIIRTHVEKAETEAS